jgi:hypothetical protein
VVKFAVNTPLQVLAPPAVTPLISQVADELQQVFSPVSVLRNVNGEPPGSGGVVVAVAAGP